MISLGRSVSVGESRRVVKRGSCEKRQHGALGCAPWGRQEGRFCDKPRSRNRQTQGATARHQLICFAKIFLEVGWDEKVVFTRMSFVRKLSAIGRNTFCGKGSL